MLWYSSGIWDMMIKRDPPTTGVTPNLNEVEISLKELKRAYRKKLKRKR